MSKIPLPPLWLIIPLAGISLLSETVYTPSLPQIAHTLSTSDAMAEYTLSLYLVGFALGTLFWGNISDRYGRKPCMLVGLFIYGLGCLGCYFSPSISVLMISRLIQAFGGSIGSILGQTVCRDAFQGTALSKVYSLVASALAIFPAIGPVIGGIITEYFEWRQIFLFLMVFAVILIMSITLKLPETHPKHHRNPIQIQKVIQRLVRDQKVIGFGLIAGLANGILFSYFAEGAFFLMEGLSLSPSHYGLTFIFIAFATMMGGILSRTLQKAHPSQKIMTYGIYIMVIFGLIFSSATGLYQGLGIVSKRTMIVMTIVTQMGIAFGQCMTTSNSLSLALVSYKDAIGTASSLFGFSYYCLVSFLTVLMGMAHNGTLWPMPFYFLTLSLLMVLIDKKLLRS